MGQNNPFICSKNQGKEIALRAEEFNKIKKKPGFHLVYTAISFTITCLPL